MTTFEKEISWDTWEHDPKLDKMVEITKTKKAIFKELDKYDKSQHDFHFLIAAIPNNLIEKKKDVRVEPKFILELTKEFIENQLIIDDNFGESDKKELLQNSQALFDLGISLLDEKISPFFLKFRRLSG